MPALATVRAAVHPVAVGSGVHRRRRRRHGDQRAYVAADQAGGAQRPGRPVVGAAEDAVVVRAGGNDAGPATSAGTSLPTRPVVRSAQVAPWSVLRKTPW